MFTSTGRSGIRAVIYIAQQTLLERKVGLLEVADKVAAPAPYLGKILQDVTRRDFLSSTKGRGGGFFLTEGQLETPIFDVIMLIDNPYWVNQCVLGLSECSDEQPCPLHHKIAPVKRQLLDFTQSTTLRQLAENVDEGKSFLMVMEG